MSGHGTMGPAFAFDLDGTLIDCRARQVAVASAVVAEAGQPVLDGDVFWALKRDGRTTEAALVRLGYPPHAATDLAHAWTRQVEDERWLACDTVLDGAVQALSAARAGGFRVLILTARAYVERIAPQLTHLCLAALVDDVVAVRPSSARVQKAERLRECDVRAFVGDTESDAAAAAAAGVPFVAVAHGQRSARFLIEAGVAPLAPALPVAVAWLLEKASSGVRA